MKPAQLIELVKQQQPKFMELNAENGNAVEFARECLFARQQLLKNDFTLKIAAGNPGSLQAAILNVAAIGISLNPANQHAYLVPRDGRICLDISFRGLVKLATDCGAIKWAKAELVYDNDKFIWRGPSEAPLHEADPFSERGELKGGYCIAKLTDNTIMTEVMSVSDIHKVRDTSKAFKKGGGPWVDWPDEMAKKTIIKRAYKSWPQSTGRGRLDRAVEVLNQSEGTAYTIEQHTRYMEALKSEDALGFYELRHEVGTDAWAALFNSFPKGEKTRNKEKARDLEMKASGIIQDYISAIEERAEQDDSHGVSELISELPKRSVIIILDQVNDKAREIANDLEVAA